MAQRIRSVVEGEGKPVTLVHGVGSSLESWSIVASRLAAKFKIIRMDLRGHGKSSPIREPCTLDDFVCDVIAAIDDAGVKRTDLVGFSLGGMIAQQLALTYPDRVGRLALISAAAGRTPVERRTILARAEKVRMEGVASVIDAAEERWFTTEFRVANPDTVRRRLQEFLANDPDSYAAAYRVFAESELGDRIHGIPHQTLVVTGENDVGSNTRMARFMHEQIRDSELVILPALKHSVLVEAPDRIAEILLTFLCGRRQEAAS